MKKYTFEATDEMAAVIDCILSRPDLCPEFGKKVSPMLEELLRTHPAIDLVREELGLEWAERPGPGRRWPKKAAKKSAAKST